MNDSGKNSQSQDPEKAWWETQRWAEHCRHIVNAGFDCCDKMEMPQAMSNCLSCCRYLLLFPVILGISFLILGYYLNPEVVRVLWVISAGLAAALGLFGVLVMRRLTPRSWFSGCCRTWFRGRN